MSIKKISPESQDWFKYFIIVSLLIHGAAIWTVIVMSEHDGWLTRKKRPVKTPAYVQVVELPPDYKAPQSSKTPPKKPKRYADRTSVVDEEKIPGGKKVIITGPLAGAEAKQKTRAAKAAKAVKAAEEKKAAQASEASRIFKPKKETASGRAGEKTKSPGEKKAATPQKTAVKEAKSRAAALKPIEAGDVALKSDKTKPHEEKSRLKETPEKEKDRAALRREREKRSKTRASEAGRKKAAARAPSPPSRPNLLLSEGQVTALTRQYQASAPLSKSKTLMLNTSELKYQNYLIEIKHKIEQYWEYPRIAAMQGWEGKLFIDLTIKRDGTLSRIKLTRSSRYPVLDDAAITAIKLSSPFTTFPDDFNIDEINIHGQFVYTLIGLPRY